MTMQLSSPRRGQRGGDCKWLWYLPGHRAQGLPQKLTQQETQIQGLETLRPPVCTRSSRFDLCEEQESFRGRLVLCFLTK